MNTKDINLNSSNNMPKELAKLLAVGVMYTLNGIPKDLYETVYSKLITGDYEELLDILVCYSRSPQEETYYIQ